MFVKKNFFHLYFEIRSRGVSTRLQRKGVGVFVLVVKLFEQIFPSTIFKCSDFTSLSVLLVLLTKVRNELK